MTIPLVTFSRFQCFKTCPRKHQYQYEMGIRKDRDSRPLRMGSAIHLGIDSRCKGMSQDDAIAAALADYEAVPEWARTPEGMHEWCVERETVARLLSGYFWRWECTDESPLGGGIHLVSSEQQFDLPIRNPETGAMTQSFRLGGKIDKIIALTDGRTAIMEHKTCSDELDPDSDYWKRLTLDQQISLYFCAATDIGHDVQTVLYDVIRKPSISPKQIALLDDDGVKIVLDANGERVRTKAGNKWRESGDAAAGYVLQTRLEDPLEFGERLTDDIVARPDFYFARREIPRLQSDLAEWRQELWDQQQQLRYHQTRGSWPRNTSACIAPYRCEFLDICHNGIPAGTVPAGFVRVDNVHQELEIA